MGSSAVTRRAGANASLVHALNGVSWYPPSAARELHEQVFASRLADLDFHAVVEEQDLLGVLARPAQGVDLGDDDHGGATADDEAATTRTVQRRTIHAASSAPVSANRTAAPTVASRRERRWSAVSRPCANGLAAAMTLSMRYARANSRLAATSRSRGLR